MSELECLNWDVWDDWDLWDMMNVFKLRASSCLGVFVVQKNLCVPPVSLCLCGSKKRTTIDSDFGGLGGNMKAFSPLCIFVFFVPLWFKKSR